MVDRLRFRTIVVGWDYKILIIRIVYEISASSDELFTIKGH